MSGLRRFTLHPDRPRGEHERARELAATGISEVLRPEDASRLAAHLDGCRDCCGAVIDYALQGERVRGLAEIEPPRELAPALSARLDMEEARVADERARLVRRRAASQAHPLPRRAFGPPGLVPAGVGGSFARPTPFAATATAGVGLAFVAAIALVASGISGLFAPPAPTPFAIDPSAVAWVTREADGSYVVQSARFDRVCPGEPVACTGFGARPMTLMTLDVQPASVIIARGGRDAIVVGAGAVGRGSTGGSVYAVRLPTPIPGGSDGAAPGTGTPASGSARASASVSALASASASALASAAPGRATSTVGPVVRTADPSSTEPLVIAGRPDATASALATIAPVVATIPVALASLSGAAPGPTAASRLAILEDVVLVGGRAAYSDDGRWFGFSARPADGSAGPDVYVWHVGDALARAITSDHASVFSAWVGDRVLASAPDGGAADAAAATAVPTEPPSKKPKATRKPTPLRTPALDDTAPPADAGATDADPAASDAAAKTAPSGASAEAAGPTGSAAPTASAAPDPDQPAAPATRPVSFLLDPRTGERRDIPLPGLWLPNVDPTGRLLVGWVGTVAQDAESGEWRPATGTLATGSWAGVVGPEDTSDPRSEATAAPGRARASAIPTPQRSPAPADATLPGEATRPADAVSASGSAAGSAAATAAATSKAGIATTPAPSPRASGPSGLQAPGVTPSADASPLPSGLRRLRVQPSGRAMPLDWQVRWDASGTHLAVWFADATTPGVGKLSLVSFDAEGVESQRTLLDGAPALAGFAVGPSRLAWATPPDKAGGGSRVRVLVWSGSAVGEAGTQPISGLESLVDAD